MENKDILEIMTLMWRASELFEKTRARQRLWMKPMFENRDSEGLFSTTFDHLYLNDKEQFRTNVRMNTKVFDLLFYFVRDDLTKSSNRPSISAKCRLYLTLMYLAHGGKVQDLSSSFKMGASTVRIIIKETCEVLWKILSPMYLPHTQECKWKQIAEDFECKWNFPHCVGAINRKHIKIQCAAKSVTQYHHHKGISSIVLLAACDANYNFTAVDTGTFGRESRGAKVEYTEFGQKLFKNEVNLPEKSCLRNSELKFPYFFIGDETFPLRENIMRPYPGTILTEDKQIFNKRFSRAKQTIENAFGVLAARWQVLKGSMHMHPENAALVVKATVVLHNFIKTHDEAYCPPDFVDAYDGDELVEGLWRRETNPLPHVRGGSPKNASENAFNLRDRLRDYILRMQSFG